MKNLMTLIVLATLASCGNSKNGETQSKAVAEAVQKKEEASVFILPQIGLTRTLTVDESVNSMYENMTINPDRNGTVLGDKAFYISADKNLFPEYTEYKVGFYSSTKIRTVHSFANADSKRLLSFEKMDKQALQLREVDFYRDELIWGKRNHDNNQMDMMNKAYIITTEEQDEAGRINYKAESTYLMWFDCAGSVELVDNIGYNCGKYDLKFHYKLLDYKLVKTKI